MQINQTVLNKVQTAGAKLVVVTKYWNALETQSIIAQLESKNCILGWGENRISSLENKGLERASVHFVGRLQSRQLSTIVHHCGTVHSLASVKHAQKLDQLVGAGRDQPLPLKVFVQVNVSGDPAKEGLSPEGLPEFLLGLEALEHLEVVGLSSMGWAEVETKEEIRKKKEEFRDLIALRNQYLPDGLTSAGTSRDYHLALEEGINIVRVGKSIIN